MPEFEISSPAKSMVMNTPRMGGASPWRIKVTVQAEPDSDGENTMSPSVKKVTRTKTTTIPLKDHDAPSPVKRGRGRPRKSDGAGGTPAKPRRKGTPVRRAARSKSRDVSLGPAGSSAADIDTDAPPKRKRGRPKKAAQPVTDEEETLVAHVAELQDDDQVDATPLPTDQPQTVAIIVNTPQETELSKRLHARKGTPHAVNPLAIEISSDDESDEASHVLTPTSGNEDATEFEQAHALNANEGESDHEEDIDFAEPFEHEDDDDDEVEADNFAFDEGITRMPDDSTIIDSEGFSIISVDSLPTKSSPPKADESQNAPVPSIASIVNREYVNPAAVRDLSREQTTVSKSSPGPSRLLPTGKPVKSSPATSQQRHITPAVDSEIPSRPPTLEPAYTAHPKVETPKMGRALTAGVALQGLMDPARFTPESSQELAADRRGSLDDLFRGFSEASRKQLQEGLRLGEQLAQNEAEPSPSLPKPNAARTDAVPKERPIRTQRKWRTRLLTPEDEQNSEPAAAAAEAEAEVQYPTLVAEEQVNPLPSPTRSEDEGEMSFQVDSIVASVMEEETEEQQAAANTQSRTSPPNRSPKANVAEAEEDYSDIWREEGSRTSDTPDSNEEGSSQEPDLFIDSVPSKPARSRFQRRNARLAKRDDEVNASQQPVSSYVQPAEPASTSIDKGKAKATEDDFDEADDNVASEGSDDTGMFFQSNLPAIFDKKRRDRRQPKTDKLDLSLLLNEGESLQPEPSPEKQSVSKEPNPFLDTPPRFAGFPSSPKKSSPLRRELRGSDISTPSRLHDESTLPLAQSSPFHSRIEGDTMLSTASDQRQILAEMEGVDVTSNSVRVLRDEADEYLDAYTPQERSLNEIEEVTEYSRTLQGDSSIMPSSPPQARQTFVQHMAHSSHTPSSAARQPQSDTGSEATPTPLFREAAPQHEALAESSFVSVSSAGRSDGLRAAAQLQRESSASAGVSPPARAHPVLSKFAPLPRIEPWTKTHYKTLDKLHAAHLKYPTLFCSLTVPPTTLSRANAALLASFAATTEKNYVGAQVSAWGYTFTMTPELITICEVFMHLLTLNSIEDYEAISGRGIEMGDVAPGRTGDKISRGEVMRRLCTVVLGEFVRADEKRGFAVKKTGALRIVGAGGEAL